MADPKPGSGPIRNGSRRRWPTPVTLDNLFGAESADPLAIVSPVLVFAVVIGRGAAEIGDHHHVPERFGSRLTLPVFDGDRLARFTSTPASRAFLVELLGSYTRVLSGPRWEKSPGPVAAPTVQ